MILAFNIRLGDNVIVVLEAELNETDDVVLNALSLSPELNEIDGVVLQALPFIRELCESDSIFRALNPCDRRKLLLQCL